MKPEDRFGESEGNRRRGRPLGAINKTHAILKEAILTAAALAGDEIAADALEKLQAAKKEAEKSGNRAEVEKLDKVKLHGGIEGYLVKQALNNPQAFLPLLGRVLPLQIDGDMNVTVVIEGGLRQQLKDRSAIPMVDVTPEPKILIEQ